MTETLQYFCGFCCHISQDYLTPSYIRCWGIDNSVIGYILIIYTFSWSCNISPNTEKKKTVHLLPCKHSFLVPHFIFWPHSRKKESQLSARVCCVSPMKFAGGPRYTNMCECLRFSCSCCRAFQGPSRLPRQPRLTAQSGHQHSPALLHLLPFLFRPLYAFLHSLRLPLFHALSSQNTVGGGQLEYLEFPWAPLSGISPLLGCRKFSSPHWRITE